MKLDLTSQVFHDEAKAREYLESLHWPQGAECPHCELMNATKVGGKTARPGLYMCNACRKQFTVTSGKRHTIEHRAALARSCSFGNHRNLCQSVAQRRAQPCAPRLASLDVQSFATGDA
jgi:transposase-like protein